MNQKRQLLCTFSNPNGYKVTVTGIREFYTLYNNCLFILSNVKNDKELFITYNVLVREKTSPVFPNTISIHRKKQTNTLYTLNAMNKIICDENNGVFDNKFQVNWELYKNSLIITAEIYVKIIPIKIFTIIN